MSASRGGIDGCGSEMKAVTDADDHVSSCHHVSTMLSLHPGSCLILEGGGGGGGSCQLEPVWPPVHQSTMDTPVGAFSPGVETLSVSAQSTSATLCFWLWLWFRLFFCFHIHKKDFNFPSLYVLLLSESYLSVLCMSSLLLHLKKEKELLSTNTLLLSLSLLSQTFHYGENVLKRLEEVLVLKSNFVTGVTRCS